MELCKHTNQSKLFLYQWMKEIANNILVMPKEKVVKIIIRKNLDRVRETLIN